MQRFRLVAGLLAAVSLCGGPSTASAAVHYSPREHILQAPRLIVKPNPVPLGRAVVVIVLGLKPGERVQVSARPSRVGFGGGNMGTHRAGKDGGIVFPYPAFTRRWELGTWTITAWRTNGRALQTRLQVVPQPPPVSGPAPPPLSHLSRRWLAIPRGAANFAVAGDTVAFTAVSCRACNTLVYLASLSSNRIRTIARLGKGVSVADLRLSSTWLVWLADRYPAPGWQIWTLDRSTGRRHLVDSSSTEGGLIVPGIPEIALSGDTVAWVRHDCTSGCTRPGTSTLRLIHLGGGAATVVSHTTYPCRPIAYPTLSPRLLSWVGTPLSINGCPAPNTWTVIAQDRRSRRLSFHEIHLRQNQMAGEFSGDGGREAWTEHLEFTNHDDRVVSMNLHNGAQRVIAHGASSPRLTDGALAWIGSQGNSVAALDLRTGKRYLLAFGTDRPNRAVALGTWLGQPLGNIVVWQESTFNPNGGPIHDSLVVARVP